MSVLPHAEPFSAVGGPIGVLLLHGFTGSPSSMRPWAEYLSGRGVSVSVPRLPGHGTTWQEMNTTTWQDWYDEATRAFDDLLARCEVVFVAGLSMGGCLALRLAEERGDQVAGLMLVNPSVGSADRRLLAAPLLKRLIRSTKGIKGDISKPGQTEDGYDRIPLRALDSMRAMWKVTAAALPSITSPVLVFRSAVDHIVDPLSAELVTLRVTSPDVTERILENSYHVATLDNDAPLIFDESWAFIGDRVPTRPRDAI